MIILLFKYEPDHARKNYLEYLPRNLKDLMLREVGNAGILFSSLVYAVNSLHQQNL